LLDLKQIKIRIYFSFDEENTICPVVKKEKGTKSLLISAKKDVEEIAIRKKANKYFPL